MVMRGLALHRRGIEVVKSDLLDHEELSLVAVVVLWTSAAVDFFTMREMGSD